MATELRGFILTLLIILMSCGQKGEINKNEKADTLTKTNTTTRKNIEGYTLQTIPKHWGRISTFGSDTFKVIECVTLAQIKIYVNAGHRYFKIDSFYIGTDSLIIKKFNRVTQDIYEFNLQSIKADSSLTFVLEITDRNKQIGDWTLKDNGALFAMTMANTNKKKFITTIYPCD